MSQDRLNAEKVAHFLQENPDFFQDHAELFSRLRVPHPHETRAISLGERQVMTLRARTKDLEWKLSGLTHNASGNAKISQTLTGWCCDMLAEPDERQIPAVIIRSLGDLFDLPTLALRLWDLPALEQGEFTADVTDTIRQYAQTLSKPYCGPLQDQEAARWLATPPASLAIIALRFSAEPSPFGLLILGSDDTERFLPDMETDFLETIGELASASLCRLKDTNYQDRA